MRDPDRIPLVLAAVERAWRRHPDERLGQLLSNATLRVDLFGLEDDALVAALGPATPEEPQRRREGFRESIRALGDLTLSLMEPAEEDEDGG